MIILLILQLSGVSVAQEGLIFLEPEIVQKPQNGSAYQVGDRIQMNLRLPVELEKETNGFSLKPEPNGTNIEIQGWYLDSSTQKINGQLRFVISPIKTGKLTFPELGVYRSDGTQLARTKSISFEISELQNPSNQPPSPLGVIPIPLHFKFIIAGFLILLAFAALCVWIYRKYGKLLHKKKLPPEVPIPETPDHVIAIRELDLLFERIPFSIENLKPLSFGISQILKNYFSSRFNIDATESTTDEMLSLLKKVSITPEEYEIIDSLFQKLDFLKFTESQFHRHIEKDDVTGYKTEARSIVERWAPKGGF